MIAVSMTDLLLQWRIFWLSGKVLYTAVADAYRTLLYSSRGGKYSPAKNSMKENEDDYIEDSASEEETVKMWMWLPGLLLVLFLTCVVMNRQFDMPVKETILALFLAFFFSFLAIQATGATGKRLAV
jgi:hypothetical protein